MGTTVIGRFEVKSFDTWRAAYDGHTPERLTTGFQNATIYRDEASPNLVFMVLEWADEAGARAYVENTQFKAKMMAAGVVGVPEFRFVREVP